MAKLRSPNYPNHDLEAALRLAEKIFAKDGRNKVSRATLATHLGHESLSGPALGKIGALRSYGILEGSGEEMHISEDAISALKAPQGSDERRSSLARLALKPALFQAIKQDFPSIPSKENLTYWLIKLEFSESAAGIAATSYLNTMALVGGLDYSYNSDAGNGDDGGSGNLPPLGNQIGRQVKVMEGERIVFTEESDPQRYVKLIASGDVDETLLDALTDYVKRQRKRLGLPENGGKPTN